MAKIELLSFLSNKGISAEQAAKKTGLSLSRVEEIFLGKQPTIAELQIFATSFKLSLANLIQSELASSVTEKVNLLFRSSRNDTKRGFDYQYLKYSEIISNSLKYCSQSPQRIAWLDIFNEHDMAGNPADIARRFRESLFGNDQVSPLIELPNILSKNGVLVFVIDSDNSEGASAFFESIPFIFISPRFPGRMLFTIAHELGHILAHHKNEYAVYDTFSSFNAKHSRQNDAETFADQFASHLLLPDQGVGIALRKIRSYIENTKDVIGDVEILYLSRIFGVSFEAAAIKCENLGLMPRGGAQSLYKHVVKIHGSPEKRAESLNLPPRPQIEIDKIPKTIFETAINKIRSGDISIGRVRADLNTSFSSLFDNNISYVH